MTLSPKATEVLAALRTRAEYAEGDWLVVYLDNASGRVPGLTPRAWAGHLSALEKAGLYRPIDNCAWGKVKAA